jgi:quinoprotein relay system zinc metallohydrolase 2
VFELLLSACLADAPATCRTERVPAGTTALACAPVAATAIAALPAGWQAQAWPCVAAGETPAVAFTEIAPGVLVHKAVHAETDAANGGDIANVGVVIGRDAVAVIDSGGSPAVGAALLDAIRARTALPVRWLILTHMHPDHTLGAAPFVAAGARVIGHARLPEALAARADHYAAANARALGGPPPALPAVDETVEGTRDIDLGGRVLRLEAHPTAHTDNDLTVRDLATDTWFLGDLVFLGHTPSLDGSIRGWLAVLDDLAARPAARIAPGHGPVAVPWPDGAGPTRAYLQQIVDETRAAIRAGAPMLAATQAVGTSLAPRWLLFDAFNPRNVAAAFQELEWE